MPVLDLVSSETMWRAGFGGWSLDEYPVRKVWPGPVQLKDTREPSNVGGICLCGVVILVKANVRMSPFCTPIARCFPLGDHATREVVDSE